MKQPIIAIAAGSLIMLATACNNDKKETATVTTADTTVTAPVAENPVIVTAEQVPDTIRTTFSMKFPKASSPQWYRYNAIAEDELPTDVSYYYVDFMNTGDEMSAWYNERGEWVKTSTKIKGDSRLPDAVNKTLNEQFPGYKIDELKKENDKDMDMYEIKLLKGDQKAKVKILPNGTIFKRK